jgi:hypothetical protein
MHERTPHGEAAQAPPQAGRTGPEMKPSWRSGTVPLIAKNAMSGAPARRLTAGFKLVALETV